MKTYLIKVDKETYEMLASLGMSEIPGVVKQTVGHGQWPLLLLSVGVDQHHEAIEDLRCIYILGQGMCLRTKSDGIIERCVG
ncbi:hypothetical protein LguiA_034460 [Lonicera macranthoides]